MINLQKSTVLNGKLTGRDFFVASWYVALVEKAFRLKIFLCFVVFGLIKGLADWLTFFTLLVPAELFVDPSHFLLLAGIASILILNHVLVLAWLAKDWQNGHLVKLLLIWQGRYREFLSLFDLPFPLLLLLG